MDKDTTWFQIEADNREQYDVKGICKGLGYAKKSENHHLPGLYFLILWKDYLKGKNI